MKSFTIKKSIFAWCLMSIIFSTYPAQTNSWYNPFATVFSWIKDNVKKEYVIGSAVTAAALAGLYYYYNKSAAPVLPPTPASQTPTTPLKTEAMPSASSSTQDRYSIHASFDADDKFLQEIGNELKRLTTECNFLITHVPEEYNVHLASLDTPHQNELDTIKNSLSKGITDKSTISLSFDNVYAEKIEGDKHEYMVLASTSPTKEIFSLTADRNTLVKDLTTAIPNAKLKLHIYLAKIRYNGQDINTDLASLNNKFKEMLTPRGLSNLIVNLKIIYLLNNEQKVTADFSLQKTPPISSVSIHLQPKAATKSTKSFSDSGHKQSSPNYFVGHYFPANTNMLTFLVGMSSKVINIATKNGFTKTYCPREIGSDKNFSQYHLTIAFIGNLTPEQHDKLRNDFQKGFIDKNSVNVVFYSIEAHKEGNYTNPETKLTSDTYNIMLVADAQNKENEDLVALHNSAETKIRAVRPPIPEPKIKYPYKPHVLLAKVLTTEKSDLDSLQENLKAMKAHVPYTINSTVQMGGGASPYENFPIQQLQQ